MSYNLDEITTNELKIITDDLFMTSKESYKKLQKDKLEMEKKEGLNFAIKERYNASRDE